MNKAILIKMAWRKMADFVGLVADFDVTVADFDVLAQADFRPTRGFMTVFDAFAKVDS